MLDVGKRERSRVRRHHRVRLRVFGTAQRPRLNVFRSNAHLYAQVIDDTTGRTLLSASTLDKELKGTVKTGGNMAAAVRSEERRVGKERRSGRGRQESGKHSREGAG